MKLAFFGTGSMVPIPERNTTGLAVTYRDECFLLDCGEGTQKQMRSMGFSPTKVTRILITHWHGDHVFGLPGLLSTLAHANISHEIVLYGPPGSKNRCRSLLSTFVPEGKLKLKVVEASEGVVFENEWLVVHAKRVEHSTVCYAYAFVEKDRRRINLEYVKKFGLSKHPILRDLQEGKSIVWNKKKISPKHATYVQKGKKLVTIFDTGVCKAAVDLAKNADVLVCEATVDASLKDFAKQYKHLTAEDAAMIAKKAKVEKLIITHFSQRYKDTALLVHDAKKVFKNVSAASDFLVVDV